MTSRGRRLGANGLGAAAVLTALTSGCGGGSPDDGAPTLPYASEVVRFTPGDGAGFGRDALPSVVLGPPRGKGLSAGSLDVLSLGHGGEIVLGFGAAAIVDVEGPDLLVFENAFYAGGDPTQVFAEPGEVAVSEDGETFVAFPCDPDAEELASSGCAGVTPTAEYDAGSNVPLEPSVAGGDGFDLAAIGMQSARYVKVLDRSAEGAAPSAGFDLDAIGFVSAE